MYVRIYLLEFHFPLHIPVMCQWYRDRELDSQCC